MATKNYGDVVVFVRNGQKCNALVAQARLVEGVEHITLFYLNPESAGTVLTGGQLEKSTLKVFDVKPVDDKGLNGWQEFTEGPKDDPAGEAPATTASTKSGDKPLFYRGDANGKVSANFPDKPISDATDGKGQEVKVADERPSLDDTQEAERRRQIVLNDPQQDAYSSTEPQVDAETQPASSPLASALPDETVEDEGQVWDRLKLKPGFTDGSYEEQKAQVDAEMEHQKSKLPTAQSVPVPGLDELQKASVEAGSEVHVAEYEDGTTVTGVPPLPETSPDGSPKVKEFEHPESQAWHQDNRGPLDKGEVDKHKEDEAVHEATAAQNPTEDPQPLS